eukprot:403352251
MKLHTTGRIGNSHSDLCMIVAQLSGAQVTENYTTLAEFHAANANAKAKQATLPCLELENGELLWSSVAIVKYLASFQSQLNGANAWEEAQVDQWMLILRNETQPLVRTINYQVFGHVETDLNEHTHLYNLLKENLKFVNNSLKGKTHFVGNHLTIVDIYFTLIQLELQQATMDTNFRNSMSNLNNHFKSITGLAEFKKRMGNVKQGKKQMTPNFGGAAAQKDLNKAQKKENSKQKATKQ